MKTIIIMFDDDDIWTVMREFYKVVTFTKPQQDYIVDVLDTYTLDGKDLSDLYKPNEKTLKYLNTNEEWSKIEHKSMFEIMHSWAWSKLLSHCWLMEKETDMAEERLKNFCKDFKCDFEKASRYYEDAKKFMLYLGMIGSLRNNSFPVSDETRLYLDSVGILRLYVLGKFTRNLVKLIGWKHVCIRTLLEDADFIDYSMLDAGGMQCSAVNKLLEVKDSLVSDKVVIRCVEGTVLREGIMKGI